MVLTNKIFGFEDPIHSHSLQKAPQVVTVWNEFIGLSLCMNLLCIYFLSPWVIPFCTCMANWGLWLYRFLMLDPFSGREI